MEEKETKRGPLGKSLAMEKLPSRHSKATITGGDPINRMMNKYGKNEKAFSFGTMPMGKK